MTAADFLLQAEVTLPLLLTLPPPEQKAALLALLHAEPAPIPPARLMLTLHMLPVASEGQAREIAADIRPRRV